MFEKAHAMKVIFIFPTVFIVFKFSNISSSPLLFRSKNVTKEIMRAYIKDASNPALVLVNHEKVP